MKKTKIIATIGPASESEEVLRLLFQNGVNVCRLNFSHGSHEEHKRRIDTIKKVIRLLFSKPTNLHDHFLHLPSAL
jgi:pyruvate kinase